MYLYCKTVSFIYQIFYSLTEFVDVNDWQVFLLLGLEGGLVGANERKHFTGNIVQGKVHAFGHNVQHLINGKVVKAESIK